VGNIYDDDDDDDDDDGWLKAYLVGGKQHEVVGRVGDDISFSGRVLCDAAQGISEPVQADTQDSVRPQSVRKQLSVRDSTSSGFLYVVYTHRRTHVAYTGTD